MNWSSATPLDTDYRGMHWFLEAKAWPTNHRLAALQFRPIGLRTRWANKQRSTPQWVILLWSSSIRTVWRRYICRLSIGALSFSICSHFLVFPLHLFCLTPAWLVHYWVSIKVFSEMSERRTIAFRSTDTRSMWDSSMLSPLEIHPLSLYVWQTHKPQALKIFEGMSEERGELHSALEEWLLCLSPSNLPSLHPLLFAGFSWLGNNWIKRSNIKSFSFSLSFHSLMWGGHISSSF